MGFNNNYGGFDSYGSDNGLSDRYNLIINAGSSSLTEDKANTVEEKRKEKIDRLGTQSDYANLTEGTFTDLNGLKESNQNKIWNDYTPEQKQTYLSNVYDQQIIHDKANNKYYQYAKDGTLQDYKGDPTKLQRLYMYGTTNSPDEVKLGRSRGDLPSSDYRYMPGQAYRDGFDSRATYGWDPGKDGVDLNKKYLDILLPEDVAITAEGIFHGNKDAIANRRDPNVLSDSALQKGSGVSEYYKSVTGLLGDTSKSKLDPTSTNYYDFTSETKKQLDNKYGKNLIKANSNYAGNLVDAVQASFGTFFANTADTAVDALLRGAKEIYKSGLDKKKSETDINLDIFNFVQGTVLGDVIDRNANFTGVDKFKTDEYYGYDSSRVQKKYKELSDAFKSGNVIDMAVAILTSPAVGLEVLARSSADMIAAASGLGTGLIMANAINQSLEERMKNKNTTDLSAQDYAISGATGVIYGLVNKFTSGNVGLAQFKQEAKEVVGKLTDPKSLISLKSALGEITKKGITSYLGEGAEEAVQEITTIVGAKLGTDKQSEILTQDTAAQLFASFGLGGAGGISASVGLETRPILKKRSQNNKIVNTINKTIENLSNADVAFSKAEAETNINDIGKMQERANNANTIVQNSNDLEEIKNTLIGLSNSISDPEFIQIYGEALQQNTQTNLDTLSNNPNETSAVINDVFNSFFNDMQIAQQIIPALNDALQSKEINVVPSNTTLIDMDQTLQQNPDKVNEILNTLMQLDPGTTQLSMANPEVNPLATPIPQEAINNIKTKLNDKITADTKLQNEGISLLNTKLKAINDKQSKSQPQTELTPELKQEIKQTKLSSLQELLKGNKPLRDKLQNISTDDLLKFEKEIDLKAYPKVAKAVSEVLNDRQAAKQTERYSKATIQDFKQTFQELRQQGNTINQSFQKILKTSKIEYTDDAQAIGELLQTRLDQGNITQNAYDTFKARLDKISKDAVDRPAPTQPETKAKEEYNTSTNTDTKTEPKVEEPVKNSTHMDQEGYTSVETESTEQGKTLDTSATVDQVKAILEKQKIKLC